MTTPGSEKPEQTDNRPRRKDGRQDVHQDRERDYSRYPETGLPPT